ncbi:MAG: hypothetical protein IKX40_01390 [Thermoguttaceae bacterium]|nr:hypothetical protein [Thermoguttaceae bacterium]
MLKRICAVALALIGAAFWTSAINAEEAAPEPLMELVGSLTGSELKAVGHALHSSELSLNESSLHVESTGSDPYCHFTKGFPAGKYRMVIHFNQNIDSVGKWELFWATAQYGYHSGASARSGDPSMVGGAPQVYIDFDAHSEVKTFRLDPPDRLGDWDISKIELFRRTDNPIVMAEKKSFTDKAQFILENKSDASVTAVVSSSTNQTKSTETFAPGEKKTFVVPGTGMYYQVLTLTVETAGGFKPYTIPGCSIDLNVNADGWKELATLQGVWKFAPESKGNVAAFFKTRESTPCAVLISSAPLTSDKVQMKVDGAALTLTPAADSTLLPDVTLFVMGEMTNASFPGIEMLEKGEQSSSKRSVETPKYYRVRPPKDWVTQTTMLIITDRCRASMRWNDAERQPEFAVPDFVGGTEAGGRMGLYNDPTGSGYISIVIDSTDWVEAILQDVKAVYGDLPDVPVPPRSAEQQAEFCREAFQTKLRNENGWGHCVEPRWGRAWFADLASCDWRLAKGEVDYADKPFGPGGGHVTNPSIFFVTGQAQRYLDLYGPGVRNLVNKAKENPAFPYYGPYDRTHWEHEALGLIARNAATVLEFAYTTGDKAALDAGLAMLEKAKRFTVPRGAQTWEMPLHTPDPLAAAYAIKAFVRAYELTGNKEYLAHARKWAIIGIPYVYLRPVGNAEKSQMAGSLYATIGVYGATNWNEPFWIGRPVQWIGTVYAYDLLFLAPYDNSVDWKKLSRGILVSAQYQQYPDGEFKGTLPDSIIPRLEHRYQWNINPSALMYIQWKLDGVQENLTAIANAKYRVASPFAMTFVNENEVRFDVPSWMTGKPFQALVNGQVRNVVGGENLKLE